MCVIADVTGNGYDAHLTTGASISGTTANHPFGASWLDFTGAEALTLAGSASALDLSDVTISALQNTDNLSNLSALFGNWSYPSDAQYLQLQSNGRLRIKEAGGTDEVVAADVVTGTSQLIHGVWDLSADLKRYVDGGISGTDAFLANATGIAGGTDFKIGTYWNDEGSRRANARIGEVRGRKEALSAAYIKAEYINQFTPALFAVPVAATGTDPSIGSIRPGSIALGSIKLGSFNLGSFTTG